MDPQENPNRVGAARDLEHLADLISAGDATTAVVGLGYVGLPLLRAVATSGSPTIGFDVDPDRIEALREGRSHLTDVADADLAVLSGTRFTSEPADLAAADVIVICVPTPLTDHVPDLSMVRGAAKEVASHLGPGRLVILESTTYPGTTEEVMLPALETSGLVAGEDFALAYSPERIDPGATGHNLEDTPKVVAGLTPRCGDLAEAFYARFVREVVRTSGLREAELAKLIENTYRQVNIALVNQLAILANELGVDVWESLAAAATKGFGFQPFWPGPGVGGHCISIDPSYLSWRSGQQLGYRIGFIEHANEVNNRMPDYVVARITEALNDAGKPIKGSRILAIGLAYKAGVSDLRESPSLAVVRRLIARGADLTYHDPFIPSVDIDGREIRSTELEAAVLQRQDCSVILTAHPQVDVASVVRSSPLVFDTRGVTRGLDAPNVIRL